MLQNPERVVTRSVKKGICQLIDPAINDILMENKEHFVIPASSVATVQADNSLTHAFLVLTKVRYSKIPVLGADDQFVGLLSMPMITETMLGLEQLSFAKLDELCVGDVMQKDVATIENPYATEEVLHLLVDNPFLPVVASTGEFTGIVTRREWMKTFNYLTHNIGKEYKLNRIEK
ncbi:CBS domain-containing protein [Lacticaseibacillus sharpeae JCM 1186 = DSM 20505]|uniref:CBS domain-containing protein n=1 Tax=Lacticaseibacillus sharpeae JCM 1186 = DSM 20505 TaxID=1291052 RepID=A0A0R1ZRM8_9LACO|nr:CBS domain-containing protein [Lacticaseibacillus sharpeae JCM 1186 = DSM 20505]